jgi:hypothetical protein
MFRLSFVIFFFLVALVCPGAVGVLHAQAECQPTLSVGDVFLRSTANQTDTFDLNMIYAKPASACINAPYDLRIEVVRRLSTDRANLAGLTVNGVVPFSVRNGLLETKPTVVRTYATAKITAQQASAATTKSGTIGTNALTGSQTNVQACAPGLNITKVDYKGKISGQDAFDVTWSYTPFSSPCVKAVFVQVFVEATRPSGRTDHGVTNIHSISPSSFTVVTSVSVPRGVLEKDPVSFTAKITVNLSSSANTLEASRIQSF